MGAIGLCVTSGLLILLGVALTASMVAVWHPKHKVRADAYRVLRVVLSTWSALVIVWGAMPK